MKIAILGATGMLGSMVLKVFCDAQKYDIVATCRSSEYFCEYPDVEWKVLDARTAEITQIKTVIKDCDYVINCIGIIKTELDEKNPDDIQKAIEVNSLFPHKLNKAVQQTNTKIIQIATDCVYDGQKGSYVENSEHNALDVYGKTKSLGEVISDNFINLRCSIIGPEIKGKKSLLEWFLNHSNNASVKGFTNHKWNGITTYHFAKICQGIIDNGSKIKGLQHVVPDGIVSKAQMLSVFKDFFDRQDIEINCFETEISIDRTILTDNSLQNQNLWKNAGYQNPPDFIKMISELKTYIKG